MTLTFSTRARAGLLVVALALVGGTGCITMMAVDTYQQHEHERARVVARERRIAELTPPAEAGDPQAMTALAFALAAAAPPATPDLPRARALLERAAAQGYAKAQAILALWLASGKDPSGGRNGQAGTMDRPRGIVMFQQLSSRTCRVSVQGDPNATTYTYINRGTIVPAYYASIYLEREQRMEEARLWLARSILHCHGVEAPSLAYLYGQAAPDRKRAALALLLLTGDRNHIVVAEEGTTPAEFAAAEQEAAALRRAVARTEQAYPAPAFQEIP